MLFPLLGAIGEGLVQGLAGAKTKFTLCVELILSAHPRKTCSWGKSAGFRGQKGNEAAQAQGRNSWSWASGQRAAGPRRRRGSAPVSHLSKMEMPTPPRKGVSTKSRNLALPLSHGEEGAVEGEEGS